MASISGTFVADGASSALTLVQGPVDVSVKNVAGASGNVYIIVSYDAGTSWFPLTGGRIGPHGGDIIMIAGSPDVQYKLIAKGVQGSIQYFMGQG